MKYLKFPALIALTVFVFTDAAFAASNSQLSTNETLTTLIPDILQNVGWVKILLVAFFGLLGVFFAGTGVLGLIHSQDPNRRQEIKAGQAAVKLFGGVILLSLSFAIFVVSNSTLGTSTEAADSYYQENYRS